MPSSWTTFSTCLDFDANVADFRLGLCIVHAFAHCLALGQNNAITAQDSLEDRRIKHVTRLATFIPGAGQIANRKYWKSPVVWGGIAWCISSIDFNLTQLDAARAHLIELESDPAADYSALQTARSQEAFYRRNRDLSWFALIRCPCPEHPRRPRRCKPAVF